MKKFASIGYMVISFILFVQCQQPLVDAKCYYKSPFLYISNNNVYNWTDIMIRIKIDGSNTAKRTCIYNLNTLASGKDTIINIDDMIQKVKKIKLSSILNNKDKIHVTVCCFQGEYSNTIYIK